jgi:hypothetical protein
LNGIRRETPEQKYVREMNFAKSFQKHRFAPRVITSLTELGDGDCARGFDYGLDRI